MNKPKRIFFAAGTALTLCFAPISRAMSVDEIIIEHPLPSISKDVQALTNKAVAGQAKAQFKLADMYENGKGGLRKDVAYAMSWYEEAARNGHRQAAKRLKALGSVD